MATHVNEEIIQPADQLLASPRHQPLISDEKLKQLYAEMLRVRQHRKQRSGNGQQRRRWRFHEAPIIGCTIDLQAEDSLISSEDLPSNTSAQRATLDADSVVPLATGTALLHRVQSQSHLVVAFVEAKPVWRNRQLLRVAHTQSLPIVYVQIEKAVPKTSPTGTEITSIPVDNADVVAIYRVASEAIDKARRGAGPTLIQCVPFLLKKKRSSADHHSQDPIRYMEYYLRKKNLWSEELNKWQLL